MVFRIVLLGDGNLASLIAEGIVARANCQLIGTVGRGDEVPSVVEYDLLVEVASPEAVGARVLPEVEAGATALIVSVGALADQTLRERLQRAPGAALIATGAVGGLEFVRALALSGGVEHAHISSSKLPSALIQPWMDDALVARLVRGDERIIVATGSAQQVAELFPRSANVAIALALAADSWSDTTAEMSADPAAINTTHVITVRGAAGSARFEMSNLPSPTQPRSSLVVASSVLRSIDAIIAVHTEQNAGVGNLLSLL